MGDSGPGLATTMCAASPPEARTSARAEVSVVIVNWNTRALLEECLASLHAMTRETTLEVVVVDNASKDDSVAMVERRFPAVRLVRNERNVGFAGGCNQGMAVATGRHLLLLNSDTILREDAIPKLVRALDEDPTLGIVGAFLEYPDGSAQPACGVFPTLARTLRARIDRGARRPERAGPRGDFGFPFLDFAAHQRTQDVEWVAGACMLVRRELLAAVGPMDATIFLFAEEWEWCARARRAGFRVRFVAEARVVHVGSGSWTLSPEKLADARRAGILHFCRRERGALEASLLNAFMGAGAAAKLAAFSMSWILRPSRRAVEGPRIRRALGTLKWSLSKSARRPVSADDVARATQGTAARPRLLFLDPIGHLLEAHDRALCEGLAQAGFDVTRGTNDQDRSDPNPAGYRRRVVYHRITGDGSRLGKLFRYLRAGARLTKEIRAGAYDAVILYYVMAPVVDGRFVASLRRSKVPHLLGVHDVLPLHRGTDRFGARRRAYDAAGRLLVFSEAARRSLAEELGIAGTRVDAAPFGIDLARIPCAAEKAAARAALGLPEGGPLVLCFGQIKPNKNLATLIDAFGAAAREVTDARLVIAGRPWRVDLAPTRERIAAAGLDERVLLRPGWIDADSVPRWFDAADLVVLPYDKLYQSDVIARAIARGVPVVATSTGSNPELIEDGRTGWLVPPRDAVALGRALREALLDPEAARRRGAALRDEAARRLTWGRCVQAVTESLARAGAPAPRAADLHFGAPSDR